MLVDWVCLPSSPLLLLLLELDEILRLLARKVIPDQVEALLRSPAPATRGLAYLAGAPKRVRLELAEVNLRGPVCGGKLVVRNVHVGHGR